MAHCAPTKEEAYADAAESFVWYLQHGARLIASRRRAAGEGKDLGTYQYAGELLEHDRAGTLGLARLRLPALERVVGAWATRRSASRSAKRYEAAGCDLLLCLVNPYKIPHDKVMRSIELFGTEVIPAFR